MAGLISLYFLSFVFEFRHIHIGMPVITISTKDGASRQNSLNSTERHANVAYTEESGSGESYKKNPPAYGEP